MFVWFHVVVGVSHEAYTVHELCEMPLGLKIMVISIFLVHCPNSAFWIISFYHFSPPTFFITYTQYVACIRLVWGPIESCEMQSPTPWNKNTNFTHLHTNSTPISHLNYDHCVQKSHPCWDWVRVSSKQGVNIYCTAPSNRNKQSTATRGEVMFGLTFIFFTSVSVTGTFYETHSKYLIALNMWKVWNGGNWKHWCQSLNDWFVFWRCIQDLVEMQVPWWKFRDSIIWIDIQKQEACIMFWQCWGQERRAQHLPQALRCHELWEIPS